MPISLLISVMPAVISCPSSSMHLFSDVTYCSLSMPLTMSISALNAAAIFSAAGQPDSRTAFMKLSLSSARGTLTAAFF